jgi:geranylgeranyl transferase type-2 subunit beta
MASSLLAPLHIKYITVLASHTSSLTYHLTTHLRLNAIYWAVTTLFLLGSPDALPRDEVVEYVLSCWDDSQGGFGSHPGHDAQIHVTLSGIQILFMYGQLHRLQDKREGFQ